MIRHLINLFLFILPPSRLFRFRNGLLRFAGINIETSVSFCGRGWIYGRGKLVIGCDTWISPGVNFFTHLDSFIQIGSNCDIGPGAEFIIGSHVIGDARRRAGCGIANEISVGDGTWIGANVKFLNGAKVGRGCIVASGSIVLSEFGDNCLIAGVPASLKKYLALGS